MKTRRKFIKTIGVASAAAVLPLNSIAKEMAKQKMIHQVYFWLHDEANTQEFLTEAVPMLGRCKTVGKFIAGTPAATEKRDVVDHSYQVACTIFFDSLEDQLVYQSDPTHLEFIDKYSHMWRKVQVYDIAI
ncbi:Dabb family protein [Algoriphagus sp. AGSA1]|uniref:Dabb family protein n=1 Tax=Algoriphagus sp. AGSA1 TaxID=2907213 RepID=UPI001F445C5F|nr:Dabb family protein [Algoriphagus sp. AGSA1]MCE7054772.1 Dabb family protein [Algoriphagus sp. AGSA1]